MKDIYITTMYEYFYRILSGDRQYSYAPTSKEQKTIDNFALYHTQLSLWNYFSHQFEYWSKLTYTHGFNISYIIGSKAIERWNSRFTTFKWDKAIFAAYDQHYFDTTTDKKISYEEIVKRGFDKTHPLPQCVDVTTLYNPEHSICKKCLDRVACKELLILNFYNIALKRNLVTIT